MIANEYSPLTQTPTLSVQKGKTLQLIYKAMNEAILPFRKIVLEQDDLKKPLNENKYICRASRRIFKTIPKYRGEKPIFRCILQYKRSA